MVAIVSPAVVVIARSTTVGYVSVCSSSYADHKRTPRPRIAEDERSGTVDVERDGKVGLPQFSGLQQQRQ